MKEKEKKQHQESALPPAEEVNRLNAELEEAIRKRDEYLAGWQRAKADFSNYQKDEARRAELIAKFAAEDLIRDYLLVLDSFDLAMASHQEDDSLVKSLRILKEQSLSILKKWGLQEMAVQKGDRFDPAFHEAVQSLAGPPESDGKILEVLAPGYLLHGAVLRPVKVRVVVHQNENN